MASFRCYFFDQNDDIVGPPEEIEAEHVDATIDRAQALCDRHPACAAAELWLREVFVRRLIRAS